MRRRRIARVLGTVLVVLGVLAFAWAFATWRWGDPFTSVYTDWQQRSLGRQYEERARTFALPAEVVETATPAERRAALRKAAKRLRRAADEGEAIGRIDVPRLGLDMVLVNGTDTDSLKKGPGRDPRTFMPGEGELVYIAGHRTTYSAPFAHIDRMRPGDRVVLRMPYATAVYRVTRHVIVPADDVARLVSQGDEVVALQACHPRFSSSQRYIVYAEPVSITPVARDDEPEASAAHS